MEVWASRTPVLAHLHPTEAGSISVSPQDQSVSGHCSQVPKSPTHRAPQPRVSVPIHWSHELHSHGLMPHFLWYSPLSLNSLTLPGAPLSQETLTTSSPVQGLVELAASLPPTLAASN